jgi:NAD dependent epimerase/dehydratase
MNVLVTGAGGFIGSHLVDECVERGFRVKAMVRYNSKNQWGWLEHLACAREVEVVTGDVRDYDSVAKAVQGCDAVFHLAALIGIPYSYISPLAYIKTNIEGTYNLLEAARNHGVASILVTSTSETYGNAQYVPMDEHHPSIGQSPYAASKIAADQLAISYYRSFGLPVKIVRPFNAFGPRQSARAVIPAIISQILNGQREIRLGNLNPTRDLTFVKDTVNGFLAIFDAPTLVGEVTNIGMNAEISVGDLAKMIADVMNCDVSVIADTARVRPDNSEVIQLRCDHSKLVAHTAWSPVHSLREGLVTTVEWIETHQQYYKPEIYNV